MKLLQLVLLLSSVIRIVCRIKTQFSCPDCPTEACGGKTWNVGICAPGFFCSGTTCQQCDSGSYCDGISGYSKLCPPVKSYSPSGSTSENQCTTPTEPIIFPTPRPTEDPTYAVRTIEWTKVKDGNIMEPMYGIAMDYENRYLYFTGKIIL
jgi:hypothetical protein